jgi:DNA replication protein DnaC
MLVTLLAERYERRTLLLTGYLFFREWDQIFKDTMTTAARPDPAVLIVANPQI